MASQNEGLKKIGDWLGEITNLAALLAIGIVVFELIRPRSIPVLLIAFGALILIVLLRYADVGRFKGAISSPEGVPPLGLARGSVRAFLAFGILLGFGLYVYFATKHDKFQVEIFTAVSSIISAVVGFYFGSRATAPAQPAVRPSPPTVSSIVPSTGKAGATDFGTTVTGAEFQADATVSLALGANSVPAKRVDVIHNNRITCTFDLPSQPGKWNVVVTNPDGQKATLAEGFEIEPAQVSVPAEPAAPPEPTTGEGGEEG